MVGSGIERAQSVGSSADEGVATYGIGGKFPEHRTGQSLVDDVLRLLSDNIGGIVRDEFLLGRVIRVTGDIGGIFKDLGTGN